MLSQYLLAVCLAVSSCMSTPLVASRASTVPFTKESWQKYDVDKWLLGYMASKGLSAADFMSSFQQAVRVDLDCALYSPCAAVQPIEDNASKEDIQIRLVLASLAQLNDLFRMIHRLWNPGFEVPVPNSPKETTPRLFIDILKDSFSSAYTKFSPQAINTTVSQSLNTIVFTPVRYIPDALPNAELSSTIKRAIAGMPEIKWSWDQYATKNDKSNFNIVQVMVDAAASWSKEYSMIVEASGPTNVLDFIKGGELLRMKLSEDLKETKWHTQAIEMFFRQSLSLVLEAIRLIVHRANYDDRHPMDVVMGLPQFFDDPYTHTAYVPVHFGVDANNTITKAYTPHKNFADLGIASRVVLGQSWQCFKDTNSNEFKNNYVKAWDLDDWKKSWYINNWDGSPDGFDAKNPPCTFNVPVNNQPSKVADSFFIKNFKDSCGPKTDLTMAYFMRPSYDLYKAIMDASDAWVFNAVTGRDVNAAGTMKKACDVSATVNQDFALDAVKSIGLNFLINMGAGGVLNPKASWKDIKSFGAWGSDKVKNGWNSLLKESPPIVGQKPSLPPSDFANGVSRESLSVKIADVPKKVDAPKSVPERSKSMRESYPEMKEDQALFEATRQRALSAASRIEGLGRRRIYRVQL